MRKKLPVGKLPEFTLAIYRNDDGVDYLFYPFSIKQSTYVRSLWNSKEGYGEDFRLMDESWDVIPIGVMHTLEHETEDVFMDFLCEGCFGEKPKGGEQE